MSAVRGTESIVHINVAESRQLSGKCRVVLFFLGVESEVLEQKCVAIPKAGNHFLHLRTNAVGSERDLFPQQFAEPRSDRFQAVLRFRLSLRPAEMRSENQAAAFFENITDRWKRSLDARVICDPSAFDGDIEVHAHEHTLAAQIEIRNGKLAHAVYFTSSLMRSRIRQLKPHSLSYQENTLTNLSPSVFVNGASTMDECGLCRKSTETSSSSVYCSMPFKGPLAAAFNAWFTDSTVTGLAVRAVRSTSETSGVGTRIAIPSSFPFRSGKTSPIALAAPVDVGIMDSAAARARRRSGDWKSTRLNSSHMSISYA